MSSDSSDDDDIPGLQSVSGSEVVDDSEDESFLEESVRANSIHYKRARNWLTFDRTNLVEHVEVVGIYVLCPFLYGHAHQSDDWLKWCYEVGILTSDSDFGLESLSDRDLMAIKVIVRATNYVKTCLIPALMDEESCDEEEDERKVGHLVKLLQIMEAVNLATSVAEAVVEARKRRWFRTLVAEFLKVESAFSEVIDGQVSVLNKQNFVDIGFLFVFNQACEHIGKRVTIKDAQLTEFHRNVEVYEQTGEELRREGEEQEKDGDYHKAIETYTMAIVCCPYYYQLYVSRASAYMKTEEYRSSVSDGVRAIHLRPGLVQGHICYIVALDALGKVTEVGMAKQEFNKRFPAHRFELLRAMEVEKIYGLDKKIRNPTEKDQVMNEKLLAACKQASQEYLAGNMDESIYYFEEAVSTSRENEGWQTCWVYSECEKFLVSLNFALGLAYLRKGGMDDAEKALSCFKSITVDYCQFTMFPPAYYGMGKSLVLLHRHQEALATVKSGVELLPHYHLMQLLWPGTSEAIQECHSQDIEMKLQQLQQQCEPVLADAVCRYLSCLSHHTSSDIVFSSKDYKGHVDVQCSESCSIVYHTSCWRKFKSCGVIGGGDKELLDTPCPTPDCNGLVRVVKVYDFKNKVKIKLESELSKKPAPANPPISLLPKDVKKQGQAKHKKKSLGTEDGLGDKQSSTSTATGDSRLENAGKDKAKPDSKEGLKEKKVSGKESSNLKNSKESKNLNKDSSNVKNSRDSGEARDPVKNSSKAGLQGSMGKEKKVSDEELAAGERMACDFRKGDEAIHKQTADEESKEVGKGKIKKSKANVKDKPRGNLEQQWNSLFVLPDRSGANGLIQPSDDTPISVWGPDVQDSMDVAEGDSSPGDASSSDYSRSNSNNDGSSSISSDSKCVGSAEGLQVKPNDKDILEFIQSYFGEIVLKHGPLDIEDPKILEPVGYLPQDTREMVKKAGGIFEVLVASGKFAVQGRSILSIEDLKMMNSLSSVDRNLGKQDSAQRTARGGKNGSGGKKNSGMRDTVEGKVVLEEDKEDKGRATSRYQGGGQEHSGRKKKHRVEESEVFTEDAAMHSCSSLSIESDDGDATSSSVGPEHEQVNKFSVALDKLLTGTGTGTGSGSASSSTELEKSKKTEIQSVGKTRTGRSGMFSPTNSTSSISSNSSSSSSSSVQKVPQATHKKSAKGKAMKGEKSVVSTAKSPQPQAVVAPVPMKCVEVQTEPPLVKDKWVMTEYQQHITTENFKERYEITKKEKKDLQSKLETSEDQKFKMQKNHKRELDDVARKTRKEVMEEMTEKLREMEGKVKEEKVRVEAVKKEGVDQLKASKIETKSLTDKIEKMKKEMGRKDQQRDMEASRIRSDNDRLQSDNSSLEKRVATIKDTLANTRSRAIDAEVELLCIRRDQIIRHCEQKIRDIETLCTTLHQGSDLYLECSGYSGRLKSALEAYQGRMEEKVKLLKAGNQLSSMDQVPPPTVPIPTHLSMLLMRPPGPFYPMVPTMSAGRMPAGLIDPSVAMQLPHPLGGMVPGGMVGVAGEGKSAAVASVGSDFTAAHEKDAKTSKDSAPASEEREAATTLASSDTPSSSSSSLPGFPAAVAKDVMIKATHTSGTPTASEMHNGATSPSLAAKSGKVTGGRSSKKSSFERVLDKLAPLYPNYSRDDFKTLLREVRHNNKDSLSGVSMDFIVQQVKQLIDQREKSAPQTANKMGVNRGRGRYVERNSQPERKPGKKYVPPISSVAHAPPPYVSQQNFSTEGSCIICYEDMDIMDTFTTRRLDCGHYFHEDCIKAWFKEQTTCPTCRNHSLLMEDYPSLH